MVTKAQITAAKRAAKWLLFDKVMVNSFSLFVWVNLVLEPCGYTNHLAEIVPVFINYYKTVT
jgi:hypothetical protein